MKKYVTIAGVEYKIKLAKKRTLKITDRSGKKVECMGIIDSNERLILIEKGRKDQDWILFHEIIHGVFEAMGEDKKDRDERFVRTFSRILYDACVNAGLMRPADSARS